MSDYSKRTTDFIVDRIKNDDTLTEGNKQAALDMLSFMQAKGSKQRTLQKHIYCFEKFLHAMDKNVDVKSATRTELERAMARIEGSDYATETKRNIKVVVKSFYKHFVGEDYYYPKQIAWVKTTVPFNKKVLPEDILSEDEVIRIIKAARNPRDKAIIALLYDSGIRVGELIGLRKKDIDIKGRTAHIIVSGKTGMRKIPIFFSAPYLGAYLNTVDDMKPEEVIWKAIGSWSNTEVRVDESAVRKLLRVAAGRAGIEKRIYPHLFRHSRASFYANRLTEQQLKAYFGWTGDSKMASVYVHLSGRDIDNALSKANGVEFREVQERPQLTARECPRCKLVNTAEASYCSRCGSAMDISTAMVEQAHEERLKNLGSRIAESGDRPSKHRADTSRRIVRRRSSKK